MILRNGKILNENFKFVYSDLHYDNSTIIENSTMNDVIDCSGCCVLPGLIDIHTHGAVGCDHLDASPEGEQMISDFMLSHGVTTYLATIMTQSHEKMSAALKNIADLKNRNMSGAKIGGVYLEGPYFSQKYKGAQNPDFIRNPSKEEFENFIKDSDDMIKVISLSPELEGSQEFIKEFTKKLTVAIGHTDSDYDCAMQAIENGASDFTHTFNGMRGLHHRNPNAVGAAFDSDAFCECICDGVHIHPAVIRLLFKVKGRDKVVLISDSIRPAGMPDGDYFSSEMGVIVKNGKAFLTDGTLAGSTTYLLDCVRKAVQFGIPLEDAVKAASANPAIVAGIFDKVGSLSIGKQADILVLDDNLQIKHIIKKGKIIV